MQQRVFTIAENAPVARETYRLRLAGDTAAITAPGQFVDIRLAGRFLRRPVSVCSWSDGALTLYYKVAGAGTAQLSTLAPGTELDLLVGLGNGFDLAKGGAHPILLGGGIGNLIDRVLNGEVVDYINLLFMRFAVFNFADICVCVGVALWVLVIFLEELHEDTKKGPKEQ